MSGSSTDVSHAARASSSVLSAVRRRFARLSRGRHGGTQAPMIFVCGISRSGTTLLAAMLDAHPDVTMGYELVPPGDLVAAEVVAEIDSVRGTAGGDLKRIGDQVRKGGNTELGKWLVRCHRAGATPPEVQAALAADETGATRELSADDRLTLAGRVVDAVRIRDQKKIAGFKLTGDFRRARRLFPNGRFVYILRDPRDVLASQIDRGFGRAPAEVCATWTSRMREFAQLAKESPGKATMIRYEDLVRDPEGTLRKVFDVLPVAFDRAVLAVQSSDAAILRTGHPNAARIAQGVFTTSVGRGARDLSPEVLAEVETLCGDQMDRHGYERAGAGTPTKGRLPRLSDREIAKKQRAFAKRRVFAVEDYEQLLAPYLTDEYESLRLIDYVHLPDLGDRRVLLIRHDVDHDHLTAVKIAEWEAARGIRSTYCLLHTAWYYGELAGNEYVRTQDVLDCAHRLLDLGHEVNFHNNVVALALTTPSVEPAELLRNELEFFRGEGIPIAGTSTHGDALCRELNFRNWELFKECCDDRFGGPRTVTHGANGNSVSVELGKLPMSDFGLEYEAYDIARDVYHTESGGRLRTRKNARGRRPFGRKDPSRGEVVGVLTHPEWWDFSGT